MFIMYQRENKNHNFEISEQLIALIALVVKMNTPFNKILYLKSFIWRLLIALLFLVDDKENRLPN